LIVAIAGMMFPFYPGAPSMMQPMQPMASQAMETGTATLENSVKCEPSPAQQESDPVDDHDTPLRVCKPAALHVSSCETAAKQLVAQLASSNGSHTTLSPSLGSAFRSIHAVRV
jgi:hypothetical protein